MDIYLTDHGHRLPIDDIHTCLHDAGTDIIQQIAARGDGPADIKNYRSGNVRLTFVYLRMTLTMVGDVLDTLKQIVTTYDWTFATRVAIEDTNLGRIGIMYIWYYQESGSSVASSRVSAMQATQVVNGSTSITSEASQNSSLTIRPLSPYPIVVPGSTISIICERFGRSLSIKMVAAMLVEAQSYVAAQMIDAGPLLPVRRQSMWQYEGVVLEMTPSNRLTWFDLMTALEGLLNFVSTFEAFEFSFEIRYQGFRSLGTGHLATKAE